MLLAARTPIVMILIIGIFHCFNFQFYQPINLPADPSTNVILFNTPYDKQDNQSFHLQFCSAPANNTPSLQLPADTTVNSLASNSLPFKSPLYPTINTLSWKPLSCSLAVGWPGSIAHPLSVTITLVTDTEIKSYSFPDSQSFSIISIYVDKSTRY